MTTLHEVMGSDALYLKRIRATPTIQFGILKMPPRHLVMLCSTRTLKAEDETAFSSVHTACARATETHSLCYRLRTDYSIIYNKPTRCNSGSIVFIKNYKYALHVSDALCVHHQEHYKL